MALLPQSLLASEPVSSSELVENFKKYDGQEVVYRGEVVGDVIKRESYVWLNVNDDSYSSKSIPDGGRLSGYNSGQSVWAPYDEAKKITYTGSYSFQGDVVEVKGVFNAVCPEHGGEMDIHASSLKILKTGREIKHQIPRSKILALVILALILFLLAALKFLPHLLALVS